MEAGREVLVRVSAALAGGDPAELSDALVGADRTGDPAAVEEVLLQSYLFLGYPAALNAFALWREISGREADPPADDTSSWESRGARVCQTVYGGQYDRLRANVRRLHPDMERWMVEEGYGKVLGRPGLDLATRELCIVALLSVLDAPRQLYSHLRGALNAGASGADVDRALELASGPAEAGARDRAMETWEAVRSRSDGED
ncbi:MAG: carboxymuconolactone decarboxylase family protein [Gemmatimonadota bacterium]|jgi:4-carboxymuconolactone decarboxylase